MVLAPLSPPPFGKRPSGTSTILSVSRRTKRWAFPLKPTLIFFRLFLRHSRRAMCHIAPSPKKTQSSIALECVNVGIEALIEGMIYVRIQGGGKGGECMSMLLLTSFGGRRNGAARSSAFADNCFQDNKECKKARILSCIILPGNEHIWFPTPSIGPAESQCPGEKRYFVW